MICLSHPEMPGTPPSRAKAKIMRLSDVMPASAQRKFDATMPTAITSLMILGIVDESST